MCHNIEEKISLLNDTKHDRVYKSVTEIKDHAKNFPNAPRIIDKIQPSIRRTIIKGTLVWGGGEGGGVGYSIFIHS